MSLHVDQQLYSVEKSNFPGEALKFPRDMFIDDYYFSRFQNLHEVIIFKDFLSTIPEDFQYISTKPSSLKILDLRVYICSIMEPEKRKGHHRVKVLDSFSSDK